MPLSQAILGYGTLWELGDGATPTENFTAIAEPHDINGVGSTFPLVDVTHQQSPNAYKEYIAGLLDNDEFTVTCNYIPANATHNAITGLRAQNVNRARANQKLIWPFSPAVTLSFAALVPKLTVDAPTESSIKLHASVKPTGPMVLS